MVDFWSLSLTLTTSAYIFSWFLPALNRRFRGKEVAVVEERCCRLDSAIRLFAGRHSYIVAETFAGEKVKIDIDERTLEPRVTRNFIDLFPYDRYRAVTALPGQTIESVIETVTRITKAKPYHRRKRMCQHIARDSLVELSGLHLEELRSEAIQLMCHRWPEEYRDDSVCAEELYSHRLNVSNRDIKPEEPPEAIPLPGAEEVPPSNPFEDIWPKSAADAVAQFLRDIDFTRSPPVA